ncbi:MAG TPA: GTPase domain-containing protein [Polyangiaceae bacterium]|jgi:signal recognition particle receptor subunit beta
MPVVNPLLRELVFKVVYYGPGLGGKTTSLQYIHATAKPEHRGKMVSLATPVDRTLYFDFLPIRVPHVRGMNVRLQLFTVPGQVHYNATRKLVLTGVDGVVLVFDSQSVRSDANLETVENLKENLGGHGRNLSELPHVVQYNKRDLYDVVPIDELEKQLNRDRAPSFATVATTGEGIYESLESITRAVLEDFERRVPEARGLEPTSLELPEGGLAEALRRAEDGGWGDEQAERASRAVSRQPSGVLRLSELPETDLGEDAARAVSGDEARTTIADATPPERESKPEVAVMVEPEPQPRVSFPPPRPASAPPFSFEALWPMNERPLVRELEGALADGAFDSALAVADQLVARTLASAAGLLGGTDAPRDPATVVLLLGLDGRRYLAFRSLVRSVRSGGSASASDALGAYALAIEVRSARVRID